MKFLIIFVICIVIHFIECNFFINQTIDTSKNLEIIIPIEIVKNYVRKFFNNDNMFLSITSSSSDNEQKILQMDIVMNLLKKTEIKNITYTLLRKLIYQYQRKYRAAFNILFVDGSKSLK